MKKKNFTIDDLARMVQKGFSETAREMATKEQVDNLEKWAKGRFDSVEKRLERIEKKVEGVVYLRDFEKLESRVRVLEEALSIKP